MDRKPANHRSRRIAIALALLLALSVLLLAGPALRTPQPAATALSQVVREISAGKVRQATVDDRNQILSVTLRNGTQQTTEFPLLYSETLTKALLAHKVKVTTYVPASGSLLTTLLELLVPVVGIGLILVWAMRGSGMGIGRFAKGRGTVVEAPATRFTDVAGVPEVVEELRELVALLHNPDFARATGARIPRGVLLAGPPGTGKTLLARALAGEAGVPFIAISGSEFAETFVGVGPARVRRIFDKAKQAGRAIIFVDEIDAVARARTGAAPLGGNVEHENTLNQLLSEMDGFTGNGVIVLGATNRPDVLDKAILRPGRFDRTIEVPPPDRAGRLDILRLHVANKRLAPDVDLPSIARRSAGMTGADLAQVVNEAALEAARHHRREIIQDDFESALKVTVLGRERRSASITERDQQIVAFHEAGHATASLVHPHANRPVSVTIVPRGASGGATWHDLSDDRFQTRAQDMASLVVLYAGRAGEMRLLEGTFTQGAEGDIRVATQLATQMVAQRGMGNDIHAYIDMEKATFGPTADKVREEVDTMLAEAFTEAQLLLSAHGPLHDAIAQGLMAKETLTLEDLLAICAEVEPEVLRRTQAACSHSEPATPAVA